MIGLRSGIVFGRHVSFCGPTFCVVIPECNLAASITPNQNVPAVQKTNNNKYVEATQKCRANTRTVQLTQTVD